jgi:rubrerythrin
MGEAVRFDDIAPDDKVMFLNSAREKHPGVDLTGSAFETSSPQITLGWVCRNCGGGFAIDDVLVADGEPQCPTCGARGWEWVHPRANPSGGS